MDKYKLSFWLSFAAWLIVIICATTVRVVSVEPEPPTPSKSVEDMMLDIIIANADVNKPAAEPVTYEDWFRENATNAGEFKLTHYCCEVREHICGTGDGITATGVPVTAGWTCAVDPSVIPYGAEIMVDYGDRVEFWKAQDCGGSIRGNHIDLAVETHIDALEMGITSAAVYWMEVSHEFD
jgi:3D (Asp-Asp-Asp) domain-containing protein